MSIMNKKWKALDDHQKLHIALENSNLSQVNKLIASGVKLCYNRGDNCYIVAQKNKDPEFLNTLLNYDPSGANAISVEGESLLLRAIRNNSGHAEFLINLGVDVNNLIVDDQSNEATILYYACMNPDISLELIKKLIEHNVKVNRPIYKRSSNYTADTRQYIFGRSMAITLQVKDYDENGRTPLLALIKNYDLKNGFEKIKLLIEAGADVNIKNTREETALMLAASLPIENANPNIIKYLIEHGAYGGVKWNAGFPLEKQALNILIEKIIGLENLPDNRRTEVVRNYIIPTVDLLIKAGDDVFLATKWSISITRRTDYSPLSLALHYSALDFELAIHLATLCFEKIQNGYLIDESANQMHPLISIMNELPSIFLKNELYVAISALLLRHAEMIKQFIMSTEHCFTDLELGFLRQVNNFGINRIRISLYAAPMVSNNSHGPVPLGMILQWYQYLQEHNFAVSDDDRSTLLTIFLMQYTTFGDELPENYMEMLNYLIDILNVNIFSTEVWLQDPEYYLIKNTLGLPDCVLISAFYGKVELLKKFIPYWNNHPFAVLIFLRPWLEGDSTHERMLKSIVKIMPFLMEHGGPLPFGTDIHNLVGNYIGQWRSRNITDFYNPEPILNCLTNFHKSSANLQGLCRTAIRATAVGYGNNLPNHLASLVPGQTKLLKKFVSLTLPYDETEFAWSIEFLQNLHFGQNTVRIQEENKYDAFRELVMKFALVNPEIAEFNSDVDAVLHAIERYFLPFLF